ncbi:class I SAM-dependent methyltransferase [Nonomuraea ferruginea]
MVRGCGELFSVLPEVSRTANRTGDFYTRDMRAVAVGSKLIGETEVEPHFVELLGELDYSAIADLGCGSGQRLIDAVSRRPGVRGVGVDIAPSAVELAASSVAQAGLARPDRRRHRRRARPRAAARVRRRRPHHLRLPGPRLLAQDHLRGGPAQAPHGLPRRAAAAAVRRGPQRGTARGGHDDLHPGLRARARRDGGLPPHPLGVA